MKLDEVRALFEDDLLIKAQNLRGPEVVCKKWPCGRLPDECMLSAASFVSPYHDAWLVSVGDAELYPKLWPVTAMGTGKWGWPPEKTEQGDWHVSVKPVLDYLNDIAASWELFQETKSRPNFWDFCRWLEKLADSTDWTVKEEEKDG